MAAQAFSNLLFVTVHGASFLTPLLAPFTSIPFVFAHVRYCLKRSHVRVMEALFLLLWIAQVKRGTRFHVVNVPRIVRPIIPRHPRFELRFHVGFELFDTTPK
jgi:hypothetical protein